jgi:hypothetical protein
LHVIVIFGVMIYQSSVFANEDDAARSEQRRIARVLQLTAGVGPDWYGIGVGIDDLCRAIAARDCEVVLATAYRSAIDHPERVLPAVTERDRSYSRVAFPVLATRRFQFSQRCLAGWQ